MTLDDIHCEKTSFMEVKKHRYKLEQCHSNLKEIQIALKEIKMIEVVGIDGIPG